MRRALVAGLLLVACGARTGLDAPALEAGALPDGGVDAGPPLPLCVAVPDDVDELAVSLTLPITYQRVDVLFLIDASASMDDEIDDIAAGLRDEVVPGVRAVIPDPAFRLSITGEFPVSPYADRGVLPYDLRLPISSDLFRLESALTALPVWPNYDEPESQIEGLYQVSTGAGLEPWVAPSAGCPAGGSGGVCFRDDALPVVLMITDAPMHEGPPGVAPESHYTFAGPHSYEEALTAARALGLVFIGLGARDLGTESPLPHLRALAEDLGSVDAAGPLVLDLGLTGVVDEAVVRLLERLARDLPVDVVARVDDAPGDLIDARPLFGRIVPEAVTPRSAGRVSDEGFVDVEPGATVRVRLIVDATALRSLGEELRARGELPPYRAPAVLGFHRATGGLLGELPIELRWSDGASCD